MGNNDSIKDYEELLLQNKAWVEQKNLEQPDFFEKLAIVQTPKFLWIGCADSRVPANEIVGLMPGELFVHRNVSNVVAEGDLNCLSVVQYAVDVLKVEHIIVCGHYGCGGVKAAMSSKQFGVIDNWIRHIKDVYRMNQDELESITDPVQKERRFTELNVIEQVYDLSKTSIIQNTWKKYDRPYIHGWVYDIANGQIKDLKVTMKDDSEMPSVYKFEVLK